MASSQVSAAVGVSFVVAGPGDPDLLTVRAHRLLQAADVVVVDEEIILLAEIVSSGKILVAVDNAGAPLSLAARTKVLVDARKEGLQVVRLLSGDPVLDGRLAMETSAIAKVGHAFKLLLAFPH